MRSRFMDRRGRSEFIMNQSASGRRKDLADLEALGEEWFFRREIDSRIIRQALARERKEKRSH